MKLIVFACAMAWLSNEALRNWSEVPKYQMLEREQSYERAQRRDAALPGGKSTAKKTNL
ncbi:hypothetical protein [Pseudomonas sp. 58(2021)]|uniref:hypothetical protein n=1 Tax=Pseudomonas sp. 58(2021) TaxID=2813330 RepID=UPI001A9EF95B|nr:hypothetical protein [Pseudomonas sp. 58(2021)]